MHFLIVWCAVYIHFAACSLLLISGLDYWTDHFTTKIHFQISYPSISMHNSNRSHKVEVICSKLGRANTLLWYHDLLLMFKWFHIATAHTTNKSEHSLIAWLSTAKVIQS